MYPLWRVLSHICNIPPVPNLSHPRATWKEKLQGRIPGGWGREIDSFEAQITLRKQGKIEEKVFAETRLRRGTYGQRYDNGNRHDGITQQTLPYPPLTKGPDTMWD